MKTKNWRVWYKRGRVTSKGFDTYDKVVKFIAELANHAVFDIKYGGRIISVERYLEILRKAKTL